jgi:hypothetical protein
LFPQPEWPLELQFGLKIAMRQTETVAWSLAFRMPVGA